jgi:hypothetical protein
MGGDKHMKKFPAVVAYVIITITFIVLMNFLQKALTPLVTQQLYLQQMDDTYSGFVATQMSPDKIIGVVKWILLLIWAGFGLTKLVKMQDK